MKQIASEICGLYEKYGYSQYKMGKFEEYDLYVRNKDFLISENIITFTDTNGKLMALKPDVTLSIIKNFKGEEESVQKCYYDESVYRVSGGTGSFREFTQIGVECMGKVDAYQSFEVISLAAKTMRLLSNEIVLDLSDFGILKDLLDTFSVSYETKKEMLSAIGEKNLHELLSICQREGVSEKNTAILTALISSYGAPAKALPKVKTLLDGIVSKEKLYAFESLCKDLCDSGFEDVLRVDFSVVSGMEYYNGIVFKGFVKGIPTSVLTGGQYDNLMQKMGKPARAIGFAVSLDLMEDLLIGKKEYDVVCVLVYENGIHSYEIECVMSRLIGEGKSVTAQPVRPEKIRYKELWSLTESGVKLLERNA